MDINYVTLIMNWINFGVIILIIIGIYKGIKAVKNYIYIGTNKWKKNWMLF